MPKKKPYTNIIQKCSRFLWARPHLRWKSVLGSDESTFLGYLVKSWPNMRLWQSNFDKTRGHLPKLLLKPYTFTHCQLDWWPNCQTWGIVNKNGCNKTKTTDCLITLVVTLSTSSYWLMNDASNILAERQMEEFVCLSAKRKNLFVFCNLFYHVP